MMINKKKDTDKTPAKRFCETAPESWNSYLELPKDEAARLSRTLFSTVRRNRVNGIPVVRHSPLARSAAALSPDETQRGQRQQPIRGRLGNGHHGEQFLDADVQPATGR